MLSRTLPDETIESINSFVDTLVLLVDSGVIDMRQGYTVERIYRSGAGAHTFRVHLHCDAHYPKQSTYRVDRWDGSQWQQIVWTPGEAWSDMPGASQATQVKRDALDTIEAELLHDAAAVIL